jgi:DNA polymerase
MQDVVCADGRVRGLLQFYGANRTGRWAGRLVQVQNLPQTHIDPLPLARDLVRQKKSEHLKVIYGSVPNTLSQLIRTALVAAPGCTFMDADFSAIEARVIAWLAGEDWVLEVFRGHGRIYEATASQMFGVPLELIKKGNPEYSLRQKGKVATLALGYAGGVGALISMHALEMGLTEEELPDIVRRWREANPRIKDLWYKVENAALDTVKTGRQNGVNGLLFSLEGESETEQWFLTITLPNGRKLYYVKPFIAPGKYGGDAVFYWGMNQTTKKWLVIDTRGGKLVENIVQAIARDCLSVNIERLEAAGYPIVFHVHDEVIIECPKEKAHLEEVCRIMSQPIDWASGLPLNAEGWIDEFYKKE